MAVVPLIVGFVLAWRLAEKRPRLVARGFNVVDLVISPDGKRAVGQSNGATLNHVVDLDDGFQSSIAGNYSRNSFSPDGKKIYQLNTEWENPKSREIYDVLVLCDADSGRTKNQFRFASGANLYGVWWHSNELIAESPRQSWYFDARTLRLIRTEKQRRTQTYAFLCPDGQTLYWDGEAADKCLSQ